MIRVMLVDDQQLVRSGFRMLIDSQSDLSVVAEAANGLEAVALNQSVPADVVLMDVRMPEIDGIEGTRRIVQQQPDARIIVLTTFDLDEYVLSAIRAGASGFLLKDTAPEQLLAAIRTVAQGDAVIAPSMTKRLLAHVSPLLAASGEAALPQSPKPSLEQLTPREIEVLRLMADGLSNGEIAGELVLSEATVKTHVAHILSKTDSRDRVQAVIFAYESGLVTLN